MNFKEVSILYMEYVKNRHKKQWFSVFDYNFSKNIISYFETFNIEDLSLDDLKDWKKFISDQDFSNSYNSQLYSMLLGFLEFCSKKYNCCYEFLPDFLPFDKKIEYKKTDFYTLKEFKRFIKGFDNQLYKTFFEFMFYTGCRPGEAMAIKIRDINGNFITVNKTIDEHGKRELGTPKTYSSNRTIYISNSLKKSLNNLISSYDCMSLDYFVFGGVKPLAPTTINRYKLKACEKANIRSITLHQFRHSHATLLLNNDIDIHIISNRLGHSRVSTTLDVYTHSNFNQEKRLIKSLNSIKFNLF